MTTYIARRLLLMIPTLIGMTMVVFFTMGLSPGGVGGSLINPDGEIDPEGREEIARYYNERYGLDDPLIVQYGRWLNQVSPIGLTMNEQREYDGFGLKWPDLGRAFSKGRDVTDLYAEALPITITLNLLTIPIIYAASIMIGIYAAKYRAKFFDVASGVVLLGLWSVPVIWAGVLLIGFLANEDFLRWFPTGGLNSTGADEMAFLPHIADKGEFQRGWLLDRLWHLCLPVLCLSYGGLAFISKLSRAALLENLSADFVRTARAKGVTEHDVLFHHGLRNSLLPLITVAASILPALLGGSIIVETIFSIPGMGRLMVEAIFARDRELVLASTLIGGLLGLTSIIIADVCYAIADPRVSYE